MLRKYLYEKDESSKDLENDFAAMEQISVHASDRERNANDAEYAVDALKMAQYMENHLGEIYEGKISSVMPYGAFVEFMPGKDGLLHISEISWERIEDMQLTGIKENDEIEVKLLEVDKKTGKFKLSHKVLTQRPPRKE